MNPGFVVWRTAITLFIVMLVTGEGTEEAKELGLSCGPSIDKPDIGKNYNPNSDKVEKFRLQDFRRILTQISTAKSFFQAKKREFQQLYFNITGESNEYDYTWLPKNHAQWYKDKIQCLDRNQKVKMVLPVMYTSLQNFSITFHAMEKLSENHLHRDLISNTYLWLKAIFCEVEMAIYNADMNLPFWKPKGGGSLQFWLTVPRHSTQMKESGVYELYRQFLEDWEFIIRDMTRKKSSKKCLTRASRQFEEHTSIHVDPISSSEDSEDFKYETDI